MFLKVNDTYAIESNTTGWAISKYTVEPKRGNYWKQIAWYSSLENATNGLLHREIRCLEADNLIDAIKGVEECTKELIGALSPECEVKLKDHDG